FTRPTASRRSSTLSLHDALPIFADCAHAVALAEGPRLFAYGPGGGYGPLREWVAERHRVDPGRVVLTVGGLLGFVLFAGEMHDADRKSTRLNSSHLGISYAVFCL